MKGPKGAYSFTIANNGTGTNLGWGLGLGIAGEFIHGTKNVNRHYGPKSTQARNMRNSAGYTQMLLQILSGKTDGSIDSLTAAINTIDQLDNGTQAQLGAFKWQFTNPTNPEKGIDITNDITFNSFAYHASRMLGLPPEFPGGGSYGTVHQKIHIDFP